MYKLIDIVKLSKKYVQEGSTGRPDREIEEWIASCLGIKRFDLFLKHDYPLEELELVQIKKGLSSLKKGIPLAYLQHSSHFWKDEFFIKEGTLIPRPDTELLVEKTLEIMKKEAFTSIADVCTGSGCIGLSIKRDMPSARMILIDFYDAPLEIARFNSHILHLEVDIRKGDLLKPLAPGEVELVVANPPYLSMQEWQFLEPSVKNFEPKEALVGGESGIEIYERLLIEANEKHVKALVIEIGSSQGYLVKSMCSKYKVKAAELFQDYSGRDRCVVAFL